MKAARLHAYHEPLKLDEVDEPKAEGPLDVVVRIGAAGLCRTDLHIQEGQWAEKSGVELPYTPGHENAGWVHAGGPAVTKTTSAPACCSAEMPSVTALRNSSGSIDRIASTVPVCQMTKVGFFASISLTKPEAASSAVFLLCISTETCTGSVGSFSFRIACKRAG